MSIGYFIMTYFDSIPRNLYFGEGVKRKKKKETEYNCYGEELNNVDEIQPTDLLVGVEDDFVT